MSLQYLLALLLVMTSTAVAVDQITVAAAADLNYAMQDIATRFHQETGNNVVLTSGASGNFYSQIKSGAPFDIFFSADAEYPRRLAEAGLLQKGSLRTYAVGRLVLWVPIALNLDPEKLKSDLLLRPEIQKIAIANPEHAPYGRAAIAALAHYGLKEKVEGKLVMGESVTQAAQFVDSGNAQAALIPESLALSPAMKKTGRYWVLPADSYPAIRQDAGILSSSQHSKTAQAFMDFVLSKQGAAILQRHGFALPREK